MHSIYSTYKYLDKYKKKTHSYLIPQHAACDRAASAVIFTVTLERCHSLTAGHFHSSHSLITHSSPHISLFLLFFFFLSVSLFVLVGSALPSYTCMHTAHCILHTAHTHTYWNSHQLHQRLMKINVLRPRMHEMNHIRNTRQNTTVRRFLKSRTLVFEARQR